MTKLGYCAIENTFLAFLQPSELVQGCSGFFFRRPQGKRLFSISAGDETALFNRQGRKRWWKRSLESWGQNGWKGQKMKIFSGLLEAILLWNRYQNGRLETAHNFSYREKRLTENNLGNGKNVGLNFWVKLELRMKWAKMNPPRSKCCPLMSALNIGSALAAQKRVWTQLSMTAGPDDVIL